jgi:hypothetical protein
LQKNGMQASKENLALMTQEKVTDDVAEKA